MADILFPSAPTGAPTHGVVIDGANIVQRSGVDCLVDILDRVAELNWPCLAAIKGKTFHWLENSGRLPENDLAVLRGIIEEGRITKAYVDEDDYHLLRVALRTSSWIVSFDKFRDWKKENPELAGRIEQIRIEPVFIGEELDLNLPPCPDRTVSTGGEFTRQTTKTAHFQNSSGLDIELPFHRKIGRDILSEAGALEGDPLVVSRVHFRLVLADSGRVMIEDVDSTNGTFVAGERLSKGGLRTLDIGSEVWVGSEENALYHGGNESLAE